MHNTDQEPTSNERGDEQHPAYGLVQVTRAHGTPRTLFGSDLRHNDTMLLALTTATRRRELNRDWTHPGKHVVEVEMSLAQWGQLVSSVGLGGGTPVTIRHRADAPADIPTIPYAPRIAGGVEEVHGATTKALAEIAAAAEAVAEAVEAKAGVRVLRERVRSLQMAVQNAPANADFAVRSLKEAAEDVVAQATADIEAQALRTGHAAGLPGTGAAAALPALEGMARVPARGLPDGEPHYNCTSVCNGDEGPCWAASVGLPDAE